MARFKLRDKHYLNVEGCEYDHYEETETKVRGRRRRSKKSFLVPMYLDPNDPADHNYDGMIIISTKESGAHEYDYIVRGEFFPTFEMEPLDQEAHEIMAEFKATHTGEHPIDSLPGTLGEQLLEKLIKQLENAGSGREEVKPVPTVSGISVAEAERLRSENAALSAKVDEVLAKLAAMSIPAQPPTATGGTRRI